MVDVLTVGESMGAVQAHGLIRLGTDATISVAGSESNVAIGLARMGHHVRWSGVLGEDQMGELVQRTLRAEGVDLAASRVDPAAPTGILVSEHRLSDRRRVDYHRHGSAGSRLEADDILRGLDPAPAILHLSGITMAIGSQSREAVRLGVREARSRGVTVCLDVNHRRRLWSDAEARAELAPLLGAVDIVVADHDELALLAPDVSDVASAATSLLANGIGEVVVKLGADGATAHTRGAVTHAAAHAVRAIDHIGAGDAFVAGYLSGVLDELGIDGRLARANTLGAFAVATAGDWEGLPTRPEFALLESRVGDVLR